MKKTEKIKVGHNAISGKTFEIVNKAECATHVETKKAKASVSPQSKAKLLSKLYEKYKDCFLNTMPSFHNLLWQIMINDVHSGKRICFYAAHKEGENILGLVTYNESGYYPAVTFKEELTHEQIVAVAEDLNESVFSLSKEQAIDIISSSMSAVNLSEAKV
jgi:hypothetical protein